MILYSCLTALSSPFLDFDHLSMCYLVILKPLFFRHRCLYVCICDYVHVSVPSRQRLRVILVWQQRPQVWGRYWKRILLSQVKLGTA